mgnify:CR=1 FL=1
MSKEDLKKQIAGFEKIINDPSTNAALKSAMEKAKGRAEEKLANEKDEPAEKEKPAKKEKKEKPAKAEKPAKKEKEEKAPTPAAKTEDEEEFITITIGGKEETFNINNCEQAIKAAHARKERDKESGKKSKSRSPGKVAAERIELAAKGLADIIPDNVDPKTQVRALKQLEKDSEAAMVKFCGTIGVSKTLTDKLANAYATVIDPILDEIEKELEEAKKKK